jgi:phosphopantothenoylcysteine decarboxylase / phosphopantothenate---cysteine ligase
VETAEQMARAVLGHSDGADVVVMAAAVADFRPKQAAPAKLKKDEGVPELVLEPTVDILTELARRRRPGQTLVGFAAETGDSRARAAAKLAAKGLDLIVGNDVSSTGSGFGSDANRVVVLGAGGFEQQGELMDKRAVARMVLDAVVALRAAGSTDERRGP